MTAIFSLRISYRLLGLAACLAAFSLPARAQQFVGSTAIFPADNVWNTKIDTLPVDPKSTTYINSLGASTHIHPDWGTDPTYGIPYNIVTDTPSTNRPVFLYDDESDPGPYPAVSTSKLIEGNNWNVSATGDRHVLLVDTTNSVLYELYNTSIVGGTVHADSGAIFPLTSDLLRPDTWTSADAAGLPVFPALVNYTETNAGPIKHALRFTGLRSNSYIWPARHLAGTQTNGYPPFGQRFRLKASFDISSYSPKNQRILTALKEYGMFYADLGSNWYISGASDANWDDDDLNLLKNLVGSNFEAVDESSLMVSADSAKTNSGAVTPPPPPPPPKAAPGAPSKPAARPVALPTHTIWAPKKK